MCRSFFTCWLIIFLVFTGCATNLTMTGKPHPKVPPENVIVLFKDKPKCEYEELGFITTPVMWNQNAAVKRARAKAGEIGADYLVIEKVHIHAFNDVSVSAVAYKCGVVDRDKVDIKY